MAGAIAAVLLAAVAATLIAITHAENQSSAGRLAATSGPAPGGPSPNVIPSTAAATTGGAINGGAVTSPTTPAPTPPSTPAPPPVVPVDPMLALRQSIQRQSDTGGLKPDAVRDLTHMVDDLAKSITTANPDDETKKLSALRDKLTNLYREGKLTAAGYSEINGRVDAVAATI
jgi:hypothetical protein